MSAEDYFDFTELDEDGCQSSGTRICKHCQLPGLEWAYCGTGRRDERTNYLLVDEDGDPHFCPVFRPAAIDEFEDLDAVPPAAEEIRRPHRRPGSHKAPGKTTGRGRAKTAPGA